MHLEHSIFVNCPSDRLYALLENVENHPSILPNYLESRIMEKRPDGWIVRRTALLRGRLRTWTSAVTFDAGRGLRFRQMDGPLKGMDVYWEIHAAQKGCNLQITHSADMRPRWKTWWFERWVARPVIDQTARSVLAAIKRIAEQGAP